MRTLVVVAGTWGLVALHLYDDHGLTFPALASATIAGATLIGCGWLGSARGRRARIAMNEGRSVVSVPPLLLVSTLSVAAALVAFASTAVLH